MNGKGDRYRTVGKDYGDRYDSIFRKEEEEMPQRRPYNKAPRFYIKTKSRAKPTRYWQSLTGDFKTLKGAMYHMKQYFMNEYYMDQYNFAVFLKDSSAKARIMVEV